MKSYFKIVSLAVVISAISFTMGVFAYSKNTTKSLTKEIAGSEIIFSEANVKNPTDENIETDMERIPDEEAIIESETGRIPDLEGQSEAFDKDNNSDIKKESEKKPENHNE